MIGHLSWVVCVVNISRKNEIASGSSDGTIKVWDYSKNVESCPHFDLQSAITSLNFNQYKNILTACTQNRRINIIDLNVNQLLQSILGHRDDILCQCIASCGKYLLSGSLDSCIKVWRFKSKKSEYSKESELLSEYCECEIKIDQIENPK